ncbi:MAG: DUF861 domain-containing protein [Deltaproteobacteria bacterium]|nr:DUF861 domain-containing protein [Deltaproteobacteria bacterium]
MNNITALVDRYVATGMLCALALVGVFGSTAHAQTGGKEITRVERKATPTEPGKYPKEMVVPGDGAFDGSYTSSIEYRSEDRKFTVALWESGPGVLKTDAYPHDEYCLVLAGHLIVTNRSGRREEFGPGDTFVIPKGWAGTWNMTTRFKKQYVAFE